MDEEIERLIVSVRADTQGFARDVGEMRGILAGPFGAGVERAGQQLETSLTRALRTGKLGFEDLKRVALSVTAEIAAASIRAGIGAIARTLLPSVPERKTTPPGKISPMEFVHWDEGPPRAGPGKIRSRRTGNPLAPHCAGH